MSTHSCLHADIITSIPRLLIGRHVFQRHGHIHSASLGVDQWRCDVLAFKGIWPWHGECSVCCFKMWGRLQNVLSDLSFPFADSAGRESNPHAVLSLRIPGAFAYCVGLLLCSEGSVWTLNMYTCINRKPQNVSLHPQRAFFSEAKPVAGLVCHMTFKCWRRRQQGRCLVFHNEFEGDFICIKQDRIQTTTLEQSQCNKIVISRVTQPQVSYEV